MQELNAFQKLLAKASPKFLPNLSPKLATVIAMHLISACACADSTNTASKTTNELALANTWYQSAAKQIEKANQRAQIPPAKRGDAKNIILFVGDGMGVSTVTAARILEGQQQGLAGEEHLLNFEKLPYTALAKTYNVDAQTPDSAGTMTALVTGVKTNAGVIGLSHLSARGDCSQLAKSTVLSSLELAEIAGLSTGIVSTARITHATPAATYAKSPNRNWEDANNIPEEAKNLGCHDIAEQLIHFEQFLSKRVTGAKSDGIEVVLGGGLRHFLPTTPLSDDQAAPQIGTRLDNRNLIDEWKKRYPLGKFISNRKDFESLDWAKQNKIMGLFSPSHMHYESDRVDKKASEPSLSEMTDKAIEVLSKNKNGYFLMVESGRIDHAHHAGNAYNALMDTIEFARAVKVAQNKTSEQDTLIIVTADHSHVFTIAGYPKRGNPILGKVVSVGSESEAVAMDQKPYTTLGYMNGLGHYHLGDETDADAVYSIASVQRPKANARVDLTDVDTTQAGFHQEAHVPLPSETHGGEDVVVYAIGPGAHLVSGTIEQNVVFHIMDFAADLTGRPQVKNLFKTNPHFAKKP